MRKASGVRVSVVGGGPIVFVHPLQGIVNILIIIVIIIISMNSKDPSP